MSFVYKNPLSSSQLTSQESVSRSKVYGTNFSVLQTGGYMEVYTLNDLIFTIPNGSTGLIQYTGNTIPLNYSKRALAFLPDTLTLNSDNISSGRRRLGMLVYVHETQQTYQYTIPNFEELWEAASGSINETDYGTSVTTTTTGGTAFINAWLDSTIEGVSGATRENSRWRIFWGTDWQITGGTFSNETLSLNNNTGGTITVTGFTSTNIANTNLTLDNNRTLTLDGNDFEIVGGSGERLQLSSSDLILSAATSGSIALKGLTTSSNTNYLVIDANGNVSYNTSGGGSETAISGITYDGNWGLTKDYTDGTSGTTLLPFITGGTYGGGEINLNNALGGSISIAAPETSDTYVTGGTLSTQGTLTLGRNDGNDVIITGFTAQESDTFVTGATYTESTGILTLRRNDGNDVGVGGWSYIKSLGLSNNNLTITPNIGSPSLVQIDAITGLGYNGWGLTGSSTGVFYLGTELPFITGGTFSSGTLTLGINNGLESSIQVTGFDSDDTYITGGTYSPTTLTLGNSDGVDITITGFAPEITGGTYSNGTLSLDDNTGGSVNITGITFSSSNIYNTDGQLDGDRVVDQNSNNLTFSGGSVSMGTDVTTPVCALLELASTNQGLLIPRMTQVQRLAINTPLPGLLVFCTNTDGNGQEGLYMYKSNGWVNVL